MSPSLLSSSPRLGPAAAALLLLSLAGPAAAQDLAIKAGRLVVAADQAPLEGGVVLIRKGRVAAIGTEVVVPKGVTLHERPQAWVVPGFVDAHVAWGLRGDLDETASAIQPDIDLALRVEPSHRDYAAARAAGVTTGLLAPGFSNLFGGLGATLKSTGQVFGERVAKLTLGESATSARRPPTSRAGLVGLLRQTLEREHEGGEGPVADFARGAIVGLVSVDDVAGLRELLELKARYGLRLLVHLRGPVRPAQLTELDLSGVSIALSPLGAESSALQRRQAAWLAARGARLCFVSQQPLASTQGARLAAHHAVQGGLEPQQALAGLTSAPAAALGIEDSVGSLEVGRHGDLLVLSGPPLDLRSEVLEVFVAGERVHRRIKETPNAAREVRLHPPAPQPGAPRGEPRGRSGRAGPAAGRAAGRASARRRRRAGARAERRAGRAERRAGARAERRARGARRAAPRRRAPDRRRRGRAP